MQDGLHSPQWYRIARDLLALRPTVQVARQVLRGEPWYVYRDDASGRQLRLSLTAHRFAGRLDGTVTVDRVWADLLEELGDGAPSQDEIVTLVQQLADAHLVTAAAGLDPDRLARRDRARLRRKLLAAANPLSLKVPLFDPGRALDATAGIARAVFSVPALLGWLALVFVGGLAAVVHADELWAYGRQWTPTPGFLLAMWLVYPPLKAVHELAHAWALRAWGGRVSEVGVTLLVLTPVPYVDASAAALLPSRARRVAVSLAGIGAELAMAAVALGVWLAVDDGVPRLAAFAVMVIGVGSTLLVNGNPLMRFDGYFAMCDALDLPNLAERSRRQLAWLGRRLVAGERGLPPPPAGRGERGLLLAYAVASWFWRVGMFWVLGLWAMEHSRLLALALLAWGAWLAVGRAAWAALRYAVRARWQAQRPARALGGVLAAFAVLVAGLGTLPVPDATTLPAVVVPDEASTLRAPEAARVAELLVRPGQRVSPGTPLVRLDSEHLLTEHAELLAELAGLESERIAALQRGSLSEAGVSAEAITGARERLAALQRRLEGLVLRSASAGTVEFLDRDGPLERQVRQGEPVLYVLQPRSLRLQALARDDQARRLAERVGTPQARFADQPGAPPLRLALAAQTPQATRSLPAPSIGDRAGGPIPTDPNDADGRLAIEPWFVLEFEPGQPLPRIGARATVRIEHDAQPAAAQLAGTVRRVFLRALSG